MLSHVIVLEQTFLKLVMSFFDLRTPRHKVMMALKIILMKIGLSDISFVLDVK
jgi:hypothetical protein